MTRIAFLSTHLSGTGHLVRTLALARAAAEAGATVRVISGGRPLAHVETDDIELLQIPSLSVPDFDYANPRGPDGAPAGEALFAERVRGIEAAITGFAPDVVVTETWPFGRRRLAHEFEAALAAAPDAARACSVRDVPEPPATTGRLKETAARLEAFDAVLVHGDPEVIPLSASWPLPAALEPRIHHTGYVGHGVRSGSAKGTWILVAGGGGGLGRGMMEVALNAGAQSPRIWHMIVGGETADQEAADFTFPNHGVFAHPPVPNYRRLLAATACSVSLCGYNTVMDLAACTTPGVIVPFEAHGQREQRLRADALAARMSLAVRPLEGLTPEALNQAVEAVIAAGERPPVTIDTAGAARSAEILMNLGRAHRG